MRERQLYLLGLAAIVALFATRIGAAWYAYPFEGHPDEPYIVEAAATIARTGVLHPGTFLYPSLSIYALAAVFAPLEALHVLAPRVAGGIARASPEHYVAARLVMLAFSTAAALTTAALGRRLGGPLVGILAALVLWASPLSTEQSFLATPNAPTAFFAALCGVGALRILGGERTRASYVLAAVAVGLAVGAKYIALPLVATVLAAHFLGREPRRDWPRLVLFAALSAAVFLATTPYALIDGSGFWRDLATQREGYEHATHGAAAQGTASFGRYLTGLTREGVAPAVLAFALVGSLTSLETRWRALVTLLAFPLGLLVLLGVFPVSYSRNLLGALPFLAVLAALGIVDVAARLVRATTRSASSTATTLAAFLLAAATLATSVRASLERVAEARRPDTRGACLQWIADHAPAGSRIVRERRTPPIETLLEGYEVEVCRSIFASDRALELERFDYAILSEADRRQVARDEGFEDERARQAEFLAACQPVVEFLPVRGTYSGPTLRVYDLGAPRSR